MTATIIIQQQTNVLSIPARAVTLSGRESTVKLIGKTGAVETRTVQVGLSNGVNVEIMSGLDEGDKLQLPVGGQARTATGGGGFGGLTGGGPAGGPGGFGGR